MKKVIIDCDPGIDDAMAILLAQRCKDLEILGITTVHGNADIEHTTANTLHLKNVFNIDAPVHQGAGLPLNGVELAYPTFVHGDDGMGDTGEVQSDVSADSTEAEQFIVDTIRANPDEVTIITLGRLTNLARALAIAPELATLTKEVVIMGGAFGENQFRGNVSPCAEANIYGDPDAADAVCLADWRKTFVGLDVTMLVVVDPQRQARIRQSNDTACQFIGRISEFYNNFYTSIGYTQGFPMHDASAVAYVIAPELFRVQKGPVRVATSGIAKGETILNREPAREYVEHHWADIPAANVCIGVEAAGVLNVYEHTILRP